MANGTGMNKILPILIPSFEWTFFRAGFCFVCSLWGTHTCTHKCEVDVMHVFLLFQLVVVMQK